MGPKLPALTSLRFLAATLVAFQHYFGYGMGHAGVSFFFVLSGFVLAYNYSGHENLVVGKFYFRRFVRIYPLHIITFVLSIPLYYSWNKENIIEHGVIGKHVFVAIANTLLIQDFVPEKSVYFSFNSVSWSISCEAFFYALFPTMLIFMKRLGARHVRLVVIALLTTLFAFAMAWRTLRPYTTMDDQITHWLFYIFPPMRAVEFIAGMYLGLSYAKTGWKSDPALRLGAIALWVVTLAVASMLPASYWPLLAAEMFVPASLMTLYAFAPLKREDGIAGKFLSSRTMILLGESSFALYMIHFIFLRYATMVFELNLASKSVLYATSILLSVGIYKFFEYPAQRRLLGLRSRMTLARQ